MEFGSIPLESLTSVRQALTISVLKKSLGQDASSVTALLDGMQKASAKSMENSVNPSVGGNIDLSV